MTRFGKVKDMNALKRFLVLLCALALIVTPNAALAATSGSIQITPSVTETATTDLGSASWVYGSSTPWSNTFTSGTGLNQANKVFQDTVSLAGSAAQTYDLDSTLTGPLATVTFSRIYAILVQRTDTPTASTQDENLNVGGDFILTKYLTPGADTLSAVTIPIRPGGTWYFLAPDSTGVAITASTGDQITFTNASSADTVNFKVLILGS